MSENMHGIAGLGNTNGSLRVYIANRPPLNEFQQLRSCEYLLAGEVKRIADETGNHWRKIFNVFAKLLFKLNSQGLSDWRDLRDQQLLQSGCDHCLLFSMPSRLSEVEQCPDKGIGLVMGKGYANELMQQGRLPSDIEWLDDHFAVYRQHRMIVCPYFDYRQLSDVRIDRLVSLLQQFTD
ncbi:DUF6942 family protein [Bacterioplanoides sp.]|uniref:DUF6942 family protein n=1 Tax=Bacterioplanoides sp. TaxID=2066072 RepID=UPI003B5C054A